MAERPFPYDNLLSEFMDRAANAGHMPSMTLNLARRCNLDCVHCYRAPERRHLPEELTTEEWIRVVREAVSHLGTFWLTLSGGEPLSRKDWRELVAEFDGMGLGQHIFTNGTYIDESAARFLGAHRIYRVQVTLLGATAEVHDRLARAKGAFAKTTRAVQLVSEQGIPVSVVFPVMKHNMAQVRDVISLVRKLGGDPMLGLHIYAAFEGDQGPINLAAADQDLMNVMALARDEGVQTTTVDSECPDPRVTSGDMTLCGAGHRTLTVNADGSVWPCVTWPLEVGNIRKQSLADIWRNSPQLTEIRRYRRSDVKACVGCEFAAWCTRCPASAILEGKTALEPSSVDCHMAVLAKKAGQSAGPALEVDGLFGGSGSSPGEKSQGENHRWKGQEKKEQNPG